MYCRKCGKDNSDSAAYCSECGDRIKGSLEGHMKKDKSRDVGPEKEASRGKVKIRCPNPKCNILFRVREGQEKCHHCGTPLFQRAEIYCNLCHKEITGDGYHIIPPEKGGGKENYLHKECADFVDRILDEETRDINYPAAIGLGVLFGLGATIIWYLSVVLSGYKLGVIAILVGWLVGKGVSIGAGYRCGLSLQIVSLLIVVLSLFFAEYLIFDHFVQVYLSEEGIKGFSLSVSEFPSIWIESLEEEGSAMDLLFWGIALYEGFVIPGRRKLRGYKT